MKVELEIEIWGNNGCCAKFEDLQCWQLGRALTNAVYDVTRKDVVRREYGYVDKIRWASVSVMNNISEGYERGSNREFVKFLYIAKGSAGEVRNMLYIGRDQEYLDTAEFERMKEMAGQTSKACYGLIRYLGKNLNWKSKLSLFFFLLWLPLVIRT